jgi:hypothetical protein
VSVLVNGNPLPERLVGLLATRRWTARHARQLGILPISSTSDLLFLDVEGMVLEAHGLRAALADGEGDVYAIWEGEAGELPPAGTLSVDRAIVIASTRGEEAVALDYAGRVTPRVVATDPAGPWVEVAPDFDAFLALIDFDPQ